jgi:hypothetical protein
VAPGQAGITVQNAAFSVKDRQNVADQRSRSPIWRPSTSTPHSVSSAGARNQADLAAIASKSRSCCSAFQEFQDHHPKRSPAR